MTEDVKQAVDVLCKALKNDEGLYIGYKSNIAVQFYDAMMNKGYKFPDLLNIANVAADNFLQLLIGLSKNGNTQRKQAIEDWNERTK